MRKILKNKGDFVASIIMVLLGLGFFLLMTVVAEPHWSKIGTCVGIYFIMMVVILIVKLNSNRNYMDGK
jgi:hypothetical protein